VIVAVPHSALLATSILVLYGSVLITALFFYNRASARREAAILRGAMEARDAVAERARRIESELAETRQRLDQAEPAEAAGLQEVRNLQQERAALQHKLDALADREEELRTAAGRSTELTQEVHGLEELLEEAMDDLSNKDSEIHSLQDRLKRATRAAPRGSGRSRASDQLSRRLRTLYKDLEIDDRAIQDLVALRDETMKLEAEEGIKRLCDDTGQTAVRRKVGGLPPQLSIFELGFAGKGRIYYTRGRQKRHRVLAIGAKNSQKTDLEYLSRLSVD
jgi:predicted  nucleic acid-binding Zn-ribbon protein